MLQDHGVWLLRSLAFGSSAATYEGRDCPQAPPHRELNQNQTEILSALLQPDPGRQWVAALYIMIMIEGSLEVKLPTIWRDEKQSRAEAERRGRLEERRSEEKE